MNGKRIAAWIAIVLLVALYVITLFVAIFDKTASGKWFITCLLATVIIPLLTWIYIWMYGKVTGKKTMADMHLLEDADAPVAQEDVTEAQTVQENDTTEA